MLRWQVPKLPVAVSRDVFVHAVFDYGEDINMGCDTLLSAVQLADHFITAPVTAHPHILLLPYLVAQLHPECWDLVKAPVPHVYSKELAFVVVSLCCKAFEEDFTLKKCVIELENNYLVKMEWEVYATVHCNIPRAHLGTFIGDHIRGEGRLSHTFHRLARALALDQRMLAMSPATILLACKLLHQRRAFRPQVERRQLFLIHLFLALSKNYEVSMGAVMRSYIQMQHDVSVDLDISGENEDTVESIDLDVEMEA